MDACVSSDFSHSILPQACVKSRLYRPYSAGEGEFVMLKKLILCLCLIVSVSAITGCHAEAKTDKGHGVEGSVG